MEQVIQKIKSEGIAPESRWAVNWKNYLFWTVWSLMLFLGAAFLSLIVLNFFDLGRDFFGFLDLPPARWGRLLMLTTPFVWLGLAAVALISGILALRKTKWGYRYNLLLITSLSVLAISILAGLLHFSNVNRHLGGSFYQHRMEPGREWAFPAARRWRLPEEGFLGGRILSIGGESFRLEDFDKQTWEVILTLQDGQPPISPLSEGMYVGLTGEKIGQRLFRAELIKEILLRKQSPMDGRGMRDGGVPLRPEIIP